MTLQLSSRLNPLRWLQAVARRVHADDRGNLGVLLLLTLWAMVALIGVVWNTGEYAHRRRVVQTAADSAAHAANVWVSRTTNLTAATNMLQCQNGSAEVILRSIEPTATTIQRRFDTERRRTLRLRDGNTAGEPERGVPDCEYFDELLGQGSWAGRGRGDELRKELAGLAPPVLQAMNRVLPLVPEPRHSQLHRQIPEHLRRNDVALNWLVGTWVGGGKPAVPAHPTHPGGGLRPTVGNWVTNEVRTRLEDILRTLDEEQTWLDRWVSQTAPAVTGTTPDDLRQKRTEIFDYQREIAQLTPQCVDEQRSALADFYRTDLTFATPGRPTSEARPAAVNAPIQPAAEVPSEDRVDTIRQRYPAAAAARGLPVQFAVDPVNVNVEQDVIWHPGTDEFVPSPAIQLRRQVFTETFHVNGGQWGDLPCAPLSRYFNERVLRDREGLRTEPQRIDAIRTSLGGRVRGCPPPPEVPDVPRQIADPVPNQPDIPIAPEAVPQLPIPDSLTDAEKAAIRAINERTREFNQKVARYVSELRNLADPATSLHAQVESLSETASQRFADATYLGNVESNRRLVLYLMGRDRTFMVLKTYKLRPIPDWAKPGMRESAYEYVRRSVRERNLGRLTNDARRKLEEWAFRVLFGIYAEEARAADRPTGPAAARARQEARQFANANAPGLARTLVDRASDQIAREVAAEWVERPWPYEIEPPDEPVPPARGVSDDERRRTYSLLAGARSNSDSAPRPVMPKVFRQDDITLTAFAQGETFNWMEFHEDFGAGDRFDEVTHFLHNSYGGAPRPWRLSTTGGWTWQPRLALSDALGEAMTDGEEFRQFLNDAGITTHDRDALDNLVLH